MMQRTTLFFSLAVSMAVLLAAGQSSTAQAQQKLVADDATGGDEFGLRVATWASRVAVSAPAHGAGGFHAGAVYVFRLGAGQWVQEQKILSSDLAARDLFGHGLALRGETLFVGAPGNDPGGAVYVFRFDGASWIESQKLVADDLTPGAELGAFLVSDGTRILAGARRVGQTGAAYVFRFDGARWAQEEKLVGEDSLAGDLFGTPGYISDSLALVGASGAGAAYVFEYDGNRWSQSQKLVAADGGPGDELGRSLLFVDGQIVVGAPGAAVDGVDAGAVYVFRQAQGTWIEQQKLTGASMDGDLFGLSMTSRSGAGNTELVVGARIGDGVVTDTGSADSFRLDGTFWQHENGLAAPDGAAGDQFGQSVALDGSRLVVGARFHQGTGAAYLFELPNAAGCFEEGFDGQAPDPGWTLVGVGNANQESAVVVDVEGDGKLALTADGATAFYGADNAGFFFRTVADDFRLEAEIDGTTMTTGGQYRKAGLMVRASLDPWDIRLLALLVPFWQNTDQTHLQFVARESHGTPGRLPVARDVVGVPRILSLAIVRSGQNLAVEYSLDQGATWIRPTTGLGGTITIDELPPSLLIGLAMVSNNISVTSTALFDEVAICPSPGSAGRGANPSSSR